MNNIYSLFYYKNQNKLLKCFNPKTAFAYYSDYKINLISKEKEKGGVSDLWEELKKIEVSAFYPSPYVLHLSFEAGFEFLDLSSSKTDEPLAIFIKYNDFEFQIRESFAERVNLRLKKSISLKEYKNKFKEVYKNLLLGNFYELNLTSKFHYKIKSSDLLKLEKVFFSKDKNLSSFAHASFIPTLYKIFLSNSPEALFMSKKDNKSLLIKTAPIKGTKKWEKGASLKDAFNALKNDPKEEAELFMIVDLLRNDLTKIAMTPAKVEKLKAPLLVPGLIHQYSLLSTRVPKNTSVFSLIFALFPGGSITGAPKKSVLEFTREIEKENREFYTGSTLLFFKDSFSASINIRTLEVDTKNLRASYGAGGGITLNSTDKEEYLEMASKVKSFMSLLKGNS